MPKMRTLVSLFFILSHQAFKILVSQHSILQFHQVVLVLTLSWKCHQAWIDKLRFFFSHLEWVKWFDGILSGSWACSACHLEVYAHLRLSQGSYYLKRWWSLWTWPSVVNNPTSVDALNCVWPPTWLVIGLCWGRKKSVLITLGYNTPICWSDKQEQIIQILSSRCDFLASRALLRLLILCLYSEFLLTGWLSNIQSYGVLFSRELIKSRSKFSYISY